MTTKSTLLRHYAQRFKSTLMVGFGVSIKPSRRTCSHFEIQPAIFPYSLFCTRFHSFFEKYFRSVINSILLFASRKNNMPFTSLTKLAALAVLSSTVAGHGYVTNVTVAGTTYSGYLPYLDPYYSPVPSRIVRPVQGNGPIDDLNLIDLQCGGYTAGGIIGTTPAKLHAGPVAAGSDVSLDWTLW